MKKYIYQKFLLNCNYESIRLEQIPEYETSTELIMPYGTGYCLFDVGQPVLRRIQLTELDKMIDTEDDWNAFVKSLEGIDCLVIEKQKMSANPIIRAYRQATLQAYCLRLSAIDTEICFKTAEV